MKQHLKIIFLLALPLFMSLTATAQNRQKGLLWQVTGNGLKKPSYVYGTMHVSQKIAFHLGDSFYLALSKSDIVALEQDLDSVIHRWISENEYDNPEDAEKVYQRGTYQFLDLYDFTLNSYDKELLARKLSAEVREVNYLLKRGDQDDFEEDAWLDLYIYQIAKKLGKGFTGVEGYEESRDLVKKSAKEPKGIDNKGKKPRRYNYKLRQQVAESYRKGDIYMLDSIDRMTETDHYLEYMLYRRNANMVRRIDSIIRTGKTMFTAVGCSHLPGSKGVLQLLMDRGYKVRPVQSIALEKSQMAKKFEEKKLKHKYSTYTSDDGLISATLPTRLTKVNDNSYYSSYLSPDLANGYYYQIEKITCNTVFSGKSPEDILLVIDTMIFENIPGEIASKKNITSNGFSGMEVVTQLKTGDLNRFQILASPFNVYIIRMAGKQEFATSSDADAFFRSIRINEGNASNWRKINSPDSIFSIEIPNNGKKEKLPASYKANPSFEHLVFDKSSGNTYLIKQVDVLNEHYLEQDTFELDVMARSFANTDNFTIRSRKHFVLQGYNALDAEFENKTGHRMYARFVICGTRYIMFLMKSNAESANFNDRFFSSAKFNGKPSYSFFDYEDTTMLFKVKTPVMPMHVKEKKNYYSFYYDGMDEDEEDAKENKYKGTFKEEYFKVDNANEFIIVNSYKYGYYESQDKNPVDYYKSWKKNNSMKLLNEERGKRNGVDYVTYTYSDTNTNRQFKVMHMLRGLMRYYVEAYIDTVSGKSEFVNTFFNTFDVSDTFVAGNIFEKKGYRFFQDFTSKDSAVRKAAIKNYDVVTFSKKDIRDLSNAIDTISLKGDAGKIRTALIQKFSTIDSASELIVPYLQKLYNRFSDTAFLQIEILKAIADQKSDKAFMAIKPILATDIPISENSYDMQAMLYAFADSLRLTKIILPELLELTSIPEYRNTAYNMISRMKDSGIISENDYAAIHNRLVLETRIEYKRTMASLTKEDYNDYMYLNDFRHSLPDYDLHTKSWSARQPMGRFRSYNSYGNSYSYNLLGDILDLSLPLRAKNTTIQDIANRVLKITDNEKRLSLLPVLLKYKIDFHDSVYETLARNTKTRIEFYNALDEAGQLSKFPAKYKNQKDWVLASLYMNGGDYNKIDTTEFIETRKVVIGKDSGLVYLYKYRYEEDEEWNLFVSNALPCDTTKLPKYEEGGIFVGQSAELTPEFTVDRIFNDLYFDNLLMYVRTRNGGYYDSYSSGRRSMLGGDLLWDY